MSLKWPLPVLYLLNQAKSLFLSFKSSSYPPEKKISLEICKRLDFFEKSQILFPSDLCWKHVYSFLQEKNSNFSKGPLYDLEYFSNFSTKMKNTSNHRRDPLKISKKIFQKSKGTHVSSINLKGKVSNSKNIDTALVYFCSYPYGTPCILEIYSKIYHDFKSRKLT